MGLFESLSRGALVGLALLPAAVGFTPSIGRTSSESEEPHPPIVRTIRKAAPLRHYSKQVSHGAEFRADIVDTKSEWDVSVLAGEQLTDEVARKLIANTMEVVNSGTFHGENMSFGDVVGLSAT